MSNIIRFILHFLAAALAVYLAAWATPHVELNGLNTILIFAAAIALISVVVRPLLSSIGVPITIVWVGLFLVILYALLVFSASKFLPGFKAGNLMWTTVFVVMTAVFNTVIGGFFDE